MMAIMKKEMIVMHVQCKSLLHLDYIVDGALAQQKNQSFLLNEGGYRDGKL